MTTSWHSYPSIYALGHKAVADLFTQPVIIQEKIDGSQFSFGVFDGVLKCRSKGADVDPASPPQMFAKAVATAKALQSYGVLVDGFTYRGEVLDKPKHNVLAYDRVPKGNIILFDVNVGEEDYVDPATLQSMADLLGLEAVPTFMDGARDVGLNDIGTLMEKTSVLGGQKIEGVVVKSTVLYGIDKKRLMGKFVSEAFKETHKKVWGEQRKGAGSAVDRLVARYKTSARWQKAIIHLRERGELLGAPQDIPNLIREVRADLLKEEGAAIAEALFADMHNDILRGVTAGIAEWYKSELLKQQFAEGEPA